MTSRPIRARGPQSRGAERGTILIVILWVSLGLVSLALLFGQSMVLGLRGADNEVAARQAEQAIEGAARYVGYLLANLEVAGELPLVDTYECEYVPVGEAFFWILGRAEDAGRVTTPTFGLSDEAGKLNLNTATRGMLEALPSMTAELAAAIIDWRDEDSEITENGAESETYLLANPGYECKNARFETVEELRLVHGMTDQILYGEDTNRNGILDPNENDGDESLPADDADGTLDPGLVEYVTVYSKEPNTRSDGSARINVSSSSPELQTLLQEQLGESRAREIQQRLSGTSTFRSLLELFIRSGMTVDEFDAIAGDLTTTSEATREGLVNVNTASEAVLACIPGIDESKASALVAERLGRASTGASVAWVAEALGEEAALQAGPYLTSQSFQASADIAAVGRHGRGFRRTRFVFDFSGSEPQMVYRKDLDGLGWALGTDVFEQVTLARRTER